VISMRMCWRWAVIGRLREATSLVAYIWVANWSVDTWLCGGVVERKKSSGSSDNDCSDRRTSRVDSVIG
jgi:hypothetical protein